jgi:putative addiction module component (TIGR02574 family)
MTRDIDITGLTPIERVTLAQDLWDSLAASQESFPLTAEQTEELDRRMAAAERGEISYSSWTKVKQRLFPYE